MKHLKQFGLGLLILSALALVGYGAFQALRELLWSAEVPLVVKVGVTGVIIGFILTITALIIERIKDKKKEDFKI